MGSSSNFGRDYGATPTVNGAPVSTSNPEPVTMAGAATAANQTTEIGLLNGSTITTVDLTIPAGATGLSAAVDLAGKALLRLAIPAAWVTATVITFQTSPDNVTYYNLYDQYGTEVSVAVAASRSVALDVSMFAAMKWLKIRSGTAAGSGQPDRQSGSCRNGEGTLMPISPALLRRRRAPVQTDLSARYRADEAYTDTACTTKCTTNGQNVAGWKDLTGAGHHATEQFTNSGAVFRPSTGGYPAVEFNLNAHSFVIPAAVNPNARALTIVVIASSDDPSAYHRSVDMGPNNLFHQAGPATRLWKGDVYLPAGLPLRASTATHIWHAAGGASTTRVHMDGQIFQSNSAPANLTCAGGKIGLNGASTWKGKIREILVYGRQLTEAEVRQNESYAASWGVVTSVPTRNVVFKGDSITFGTTNTAIQTTYPSEVLVNTAYTGNVRVYSLGVSSQTLATMITNYPTEVAPLYDASLGTGHNIIMLWAGTNDLATGSTGATVYSRLQAYCGLAHATGFKILIASPLPRSEGGLSAGFETERQALRTLLAADSSFADAYVDIGGNSTMGDAGDELNLTYYRSDKVHPVDAGFVLLGGLFQSAVDTLLAA